MGVLEIVNKLNKLAKDPQNRVFIVKDQGMLPTLVVFLENGDTTIVKKSLEVLSSLSEEPKCRQLMKDEPGLLDKLQTLSQSQPLQPKQENNSETSVSSMALKIKKELSSNNESTPITTENRVEVVDIGSILTKPKPTQQTINNYTLYIKGLKEESHREQIEQILLNVSGVLSFWCDITQQKFEIRARIEEQIIIDAVDETGFKAMSALEDGACPFSLSQDVGGAAYLDDNDDIQHSYGSGGWLGTLSIFGAKKETKNDAGLLGKLSSWW